MQWNLRVQLSIYFLSKPHHQSYTHLCGKISKTREKTNNIVLFNHNTHTDIRTHWYTHIHTHTQYIYIYIYIYNFWIKLEVWPVISGTWSTFGFMFLNTLAISPKPFSSLLSLLLVNVSVRSIFLLNTQFSCGILSIYTEKPVPARTPTLGSYEPAQYLVGCPLRNSVYCKKRSMC